MFLYIVILLLYFFANQNSSHIFSIRFFFTLFKPPLILLSFFAFFNKSQVKIEKKVWYWGKLFNSFDKYLNYSSNLFINFFLPYFVIHIVYILFKQQKDLAKLFLHNIFEIFLISFLVVLPISLYISRLIIVIIAIKLKW